MVLAGGDRARQHAGAGLLGAVEDLLEPAVDEAALRRDAEDEAEERGRNGQDDERRDHRPALSWTWSHAARGPRHSPQKVMKIIRNV